MENYKALLVDDDPTVLRLVSALLNHLGVAVAAAHDAESAIALSQSSEHSFDLLVSDIHLPDLNGFDMARRIQRLLPRIRVVYMTGDIPVAESLRRGNLICLAKPFRLRELEAALQCVMGAEQSR